MRPGQLEEAVSDYPYDLYLVHQDILAAVAFVGGPQFSFEEILGIDTVHFAEVRHTLVAGLDAERTLVSLA